MALRPIFEAALNISRRKANSLKFSSLSFPCAAPSLDSRTQHQQRSRRSPIVILGRLRLSRRRLFSLSVLRLLRTAGLIMIISIVPTFHANSQRAPVRSVRRIANPAPEIASACTAGRNRNTCAPRRLFASAPCLMQIVLCICAYYARAIHSLDCMRSCLRDVAFL
jgi:hypothetical protein